MVDGQSEGGPSRTPVVKPNDLVILVHGTFAGDKSRQDEGVRWWQRGSETWIWLQAHLPKGVELPDHNIRLFHWSGANSQAERLKAGNELLGLMMGLEKQGVGYHLVGHSHGGSVIWEALVTARITQEHRTVYPDLGESLHARGIISYRPGKNIETTRMRLWQLPRAGTAAYEQVASLIELDGLRSWTTVGTPFLRYLPRRRLLVTGWPSERLSLGRGRNRRLDSIEFNLTGAFTLGLMLFTSGLLALASLPFQGLRWVPQMGSDAAPALVIFALLGAMSMVIAARFLSHIRVGAAIMHRERAGRSTFERFVNRWMCLWAPTDEAIIGLSALAPACSYDYVWLCLRPEDRSQEPVLPNMGDAQVLRIPIRLNLPANSLNITPSAVPWRLRRVKAPLYLAFNQWMAPRISTMVSSLALRTAQGCDIPGAMLAYASPWPLPLNRPNAGLPEKSAERLEALASKHAAALGPGLRQILARAALDGVPLPKAIVTGSPHLSGKALVHTSYFDDTDVLKLIVRQISRTRTAPILGGDTSQDDQLDEWLELTSSAVIEKFAEFREKVPD